MKNLNKHKPCKKEKDSLFYDNLRKNEWKSTADFGPSTRSRYQIFLKLVEKHLSKESSILDVGCGSGNFLSLLKKKGYVNLYGSDFSAESINLSKKKFCESVFQADLKDANSFGRKKYDAVVCSEVLEHIDDDVLAIKTLRKLLKKKGLLIISVPYNMKYWSQHDEFSGHVRRYDEGELERKLEKESFKILSNFGWGNLVYSFYHSFLTKKNPSTVMSGKSLFFKKFISKMLYYLFLVENFSKSFRRARRLFVLAIKN